MFDFWNCNNTNPIKNNTGVAVLIRNSNIGVKTSPNHKRSYLNALIMEVGDGIEKPSNNFTTEEV